MLYKKTKTFKKVQRIPRAESFKACFESANVEKQQFKVYFCANTLEYARLGVVTPKRIQHLSVDRNKSKRIIREIFRLHSIANKPLDLVVMLRRCSLEQGKIRQDTLSDLFRLIEARCAIL